MAEAAALLPGRHDFRLFCEKPSEQPSTLVVVESVEVVTAGALILVRLAASHFLWKMVRRVVGTLVQVGAGELDRKASSRWSPAIPRNPATASPPSGPRRLRACSWRGSSTQVIRRCGRSCRRFRLREKMLG